eukprot:3122585-Amphidinium_carterae.1
MGAKCLYETGMPKNLAVYRKDALKICKGGVTRRDVASMLCARDAGMLTDYHTHILKSADELADDYKSGVQAITPYWGPELKRDATQRNDLFLTLRKLKLITFVRVPVSYAGLFFVEKKRPGEIRMVVDARCANQLHKRPPVAKLGTPSCYFDLDLSAFGSPGGYGGVFEQSTQLHGNEADVKDCLWNFRVDALSHYFAFDFPGSRQDWISRGFDMSLHQSEGIWFPAMSGMPMGWSWALYFAQSA